MARNAYTAKVASTRLFDDTQTVSVLAVCKTENGQLIQDTFVSFYLPVNTPIGEGLLEGTVSELGFHAVGFSAEPTRKSNPSKGLQPVFALVGMDRGSVISLLNTQVRRGTKVSDEMAQNRGRGIASRAAEWLKGAIESAKN